MRPGQPGAGFPRAIRVAMVAVPAAFAAVFFAWPVATLLARGLRLGGLADVAGDADLRSVLWFTTVQAVASTVLAVAAGIVPAYVLARYSFAGRRLLLALVTVPFVLPTVVVGSAFLAVLPESLHRTVTAVLIAHVWVNLAVVVRTVGAMVGQLDPDLGAAAATLGASPWQVMRHVTLPLVRPAVVASSAIVFLFCFTSFGIVRVLGGPAHPTVEVEIWRRTTQTLDLRTASALAVVQLVTVGVLMAWWTRTPGRGDPALSQRTRVRLRRPRRWSQRALVWGVAIATTAVVLIPLAVMVRQSLRTGADDWTLAAWRAVFGDAPAATPGARSPVADPLASIGTSMRIAAWATVIAVTVGGLAAVAISTGRRAGRWLDTGLMLPLGTSAVTIGFGLLITFDQAPLDLRGSPVMVPLGHALVAIPFVVRVALPPLRAVQPGLREAAATLGASPGRVWREVDLPIVRRALGAAAGFAFAVSVGEFGASSFLTRTGQETAPVAIGLLVARPSPFNLAQAYVLATVLSAVVVVTIVGVDRIRGERGAAF